MKTVKLEFQLPDRPMTDGEAGIAKSLDNFFIEKKIRAGKQLFKRHETRIKK